MDDDKEILSLSFTDFDKFQLQIQALVELDVTFATNISAFPGQEPSYDIDALVTQNQAYGAGMRFALKVCNYKPDRG